jgi:peroxiredoxin
LRDRVNDFREAGAKLAAIGDRNYAKQFRRETGIDFPLLIDEKREAYRAARLKSASVRRVGHV